MTAAETRTGEASSVKPSARDPIAQWLDVFTSLLGLPASETQRIRDELEDHLRTRVDDLLILGLTEPEAVQKAVTELGETAQLAQNFRSVRTHSRRRIAMHTALFAAAGLALSVSVAGLIPRSTTPAFAPISAIQPEETSLKSLGVDLPGGTLEATLNTIAEATGARVFVHWQALGGFSGLERDSEIEPIPATDLDGAKILELMNSMLNLSDQGMLAVRHEGNLIEIANVAYFDRIETVTLDYDVSSLVRAGHVLMVTDQGKALTANIETIVEPSIWQSNGGEATLTMSGSLLTVRAPKRIHAMVGPYIAKLELIESERAAQDVKDKDAARREYLDTHVRSLATYEEELSKQEADLGMAMTQLEELSIEYWKSQYRQSWLESAYESAEDADSRAQLLDELAQSSADYDSLDMRRNHLRSAVRQLQQDIELTRRSVVQLRSEIDSIQSAAR